MLKLIKYEKRSQLNEIFAGYDPDRQTWLVSDLRTKFELQQQLLKKNNFYVDTAVLRASDLWQLLLKRLDVSVRVASDAFVRSLLKSFLDKNAEVLQITSASAETLFAYMHLLAPIFLNENGDERLQEWFSENPESAQRWQLWALRARVALQHIVQEQKVLSPQWITSYLQEFNQLEQMWSQDLIVDLAGEISRVETELLRNLSRFVDVTVLVPEASWTSEFSYLLRSYADLEMQTKEVHHLKAPPMQTSERKIFRFSGMLAEVKAATAQVRSWLEAGIEPQQITLTAPDIEVYWPVLQAFLEREGIPTQKDVTAKLQSLPAITRWLANLRSQSGQLSQTDLEISFYDQELSQNLRYEQFKALFKSVYETQDLQRSEWVHKIYHDQLDVNSILARDEFIIKALQFWQDAVTTSESREESAQLILRELLKNATEGTQLYWREWLSYLETVVASKEYLIARGDREGIVVTSLMSAPSRYSQHRIFMGLSEEALKKRTKVKLMSEDYYRLAQDIGFYLDHPDQSDLEFELRLLSCSEVEKDCYFFGSTDFGGSLLAPASFWIDMKSQLGEMEELEKLSIPGDTRWDEIQTSKLPVVERIEMDLGLLKTPALEFTELPRLSASSLEDFLECPFIFASKKYFHLQDLPDVDLDVDHRTRGSLAHALFERLTQPPMRFDWQTGEIEQILEEIRQNREFILADDRLWIPLRNKHVQIAKRFLSFEQEWRKEHPRGEILSREKRFEFYLNPTSGEFSREASPGSFRFSGQIDRIDKDRESNQLVLLDYKSSTPQPAAAASWLKNQKIQLLFYMWALEMDQISDISGEVIGLFYYVFKNFKRKGFQLNEFSGPLFPALARPKDHNAEAKEKYLKEFYDLLMGTLQRVASGEIHPSPVDLSECKTCEWRQLCRAPHLN